MNIRTIALLLVLVSAFFWNGCGSKELPDGTVVSILYSCDVHGKLSGCGCRQGSGGITHRSAVISKIRQEDATTVYCDAGNFLSGSPEADQSRGLVCVEAYNQMNASVVNVSEYELAYGLDAFRAARKAAKFDFVSANLRGVAEPFVIKKVKEAKVAFIGLCGTPDIMRTDSAKLPSGVVIEDPIATMKKVMSALSKKADMYVLLSTCGDGMDSLLARTFPDLDLIIGGRSYRDNAQTPWVIGKTRILRAPRDGKILGRMDMAFGPDRQLKVWVPKAVNLDANSPSDKDMLALIQKRIPNFSETPSNNH